MKYDLIIVGSGSVGAAAGYYASHSGLNVLMIDSGHPPHDQGSHHADTRLIRHAYGEGAKYVPMVLRAQKLWDTLAETSGEQVFHRTGVINLGPADSSFIRNVASSAEKFSLPVEKLNAAEINARWPGFTVPENYLGLFEANAGVLKSELAVKTYVSLAKQRGSTQLFNCKVTGIRHGDEDATVVTEKGEFKGSKLLVSAGTWVKYLVPNLPIKPIRKLAIWHQADDRYSKNNKFPGFTSAMPDGDFFYGFPAEDNKMKVCKHNGGQPINAPEERKPFGDFDCDVTEVSSFKHQFLPGVGNFLHGNACSYDMSPDEDFIIDTLPGHDNTLVITGLSGHGFKFSSVLGEIASQFALGQKPEFDLSPFALSRFKSA